jgi:GLPGLI family protein
MKKYLLILVTFTALSAGAQTNFLQNVKVEYEKVVYMRQMIKELWGAESFERWGASIPQTATYYYDFVGNADGSIYKMGKEGDGAKGWWSDMFGSKNIVYTDLKNKKYTSQKPVFEETFLVEDSLLKIKWKITPDTRTIAGFDCRKAVGILNDSVAIFAFYTDEIMVSGGPESIQGLPGLILGMGVPRLHATWFATKVEVNSSSINSFSPAKKAKKVTYHSMISEIYRVLKNWGSEGGKLLINFVI